MIRKPFKITQIQSKSASYGLKDNKVERLQNCLYVYNGLWFDHIYFEYT